MNHDSIGQALARRFLTNSDNPNQIIKLFAEFNEMPIDERKAFFIFVASKVTIAKSNLRGYQ